MNGNPPPAAASTPTNVPRPSTSTSPLSRPDAASQGQNGQPPRPRRRRPQTDPMRPVHRPLKKIARPMVSLTQMNESGQQTSSGSATNDGSKPLEALRQEYLSQGAMSIPLVVTRRDLKELRHHVMRLQAKGRVDVQNEEQFAAPIRLHRRDPRAPSSGANVPFDEEDLKEEQDETAERAKLEQAKEDRRKVREENQAKIAPTATKKPPAFQKKTEQKFRPDDTPEAEKRRLLKYEETLPWHLEDFDNKQTWVGAYESELSESHILLTTAYENGRDIIQMVPLERWYKFSVKGKGKQNTADQVDEAWKKLEKVPKFLSNIEQISLKREQAYVMKSKAGRMRTRVGGAGDDEAPARRRAGDDDDETPIKREADADDIDFNLEEDFADDEEGLNGLFEGEEADVKDAAERLRRDQLAAAAFELRNEEQIYRQEEQERIEAENQRKLEKSLRKALTKREKNLEYENDSDSNPYASSSSDEDSDSEAERQRLKDEEEKKAAEQNGKTNEGDKPASGASTKGSNTPSGAHKGSEKGKKRPGSPNLSEASGNESSRKKHKKKHDKLADGSRKSSLMNLNDISKRGAGSGSDSEMTDASKPKKHKMKVRLGGSPNGSPGGSRAGSPAATQMNGSRAGSPTASASSSQPKVLPTAAEIYKILPADGMTITALLAAFKGRVDKTNTQLFIRLVKAVSTFDKQRGWIIPQTTMPSEEYISTFMRGSKPPTKSAAASPS